MFGTAISFGDEIDDSLIALLSESHEIQIAIRSQKKRKEIRHHLLIYAEILKNMSFTIARIQSEEKIVAPPGAVFAQDITIQELKNAQFLTLLEKSKQQVLSMFQLLDKSGKDKKVLLSESADKLLSLTSQMLDAPK